MEQSRTITVIVLKRVLEMTWVHIPRPLDKDGGQANKSKWAVIVF
jgi:hypothetical protein